MMSRARSIMQRIRPALAASALIAACSGAQADALSSRASGGENMVMEQGAITRMDTTRREIYLVFTGHEFADGGRVILQTLRRERVPGSFFFTGDFYRAPSFAALIRALKRAGHYLGAHSDKHLLYASWEHRDSSLVSRQECQSDLERNYRAMAAFGIRKEDAPFFLPPYEWYNRETASWVRELGLTLINFTPGTSSNADYTVPEMGSRYLSSDTIMARILRYESTHPAGLNGFLLLTHIGVDPRRTDKLYLRLGALIRTLKQRGYAFRRLSGGPGPGRP